MSTELMERPIEISEEQKDLVKRTIAPDATDAELQLFFFDCTRRGVHPLDKLIHFTKRNGKYTPITSIDMFRMRAGETGLHAGTQDAVYKGEPRKEGFEAQVTVYKMVNGEKCDFTATARWGEYFPGESVGFMWKKMPHLMLAKCAEALALRKAFPAQLHGLYTPEEMAQADSPAPPPSTDPSTPPPAPKGKPIITFPNHDDYGRVKNKVIADCTVEELEVVGVKIEQWAHDPSKEKFHGYYNRLLNIVRDTIASKEG